LEDYDSKFGRGTAVGGSGDPMSERDQHFFDQPIVDDSYYAENADQTKDGSYEGDLHATLGSMYMAKQDFVAALSHFNQAIRLYELAGEHHSVVMANTKFNLATLNFRIGEYSTSADEYDEALDIFKQVYGDGTNPFSLLAQWKGIIDGFGTVVDGMDVFNNVLYGAYDQYAVGSSTFSSSTESNNQQLVDEQNTEPVDSISKELEDSDTMETIETIESTSSSFSTDDRKNNNIHGTNVATKQNVKIVLPGGSSVDLSKFLQQNKSTQDEL
jgi:tetratricopeptide (TPR) repeat protein